MKPSPEMKKLEEVLRCSQLVAGGFLGDDPRGLDEIIQADANALERLHLTREQVASRMREITELAARRLGAPLRVNDKIDAWLDDARGVLVCPWPHPARCLKRATTVRRLRDGFELRWSDLSVHMIEEHGFFQGRGSTFRLEPDMLVELLF